LVSAPLLSRNPLRSIDRHAARTPLRPNPHVIAINATGARPVRNPGGVAAEPKNGSRLGASEGKMLERLKPLATPAAGLLIAMIVYLVPDMRPWACGAAFVLPTVLP